MDVGRRDPDAADAAGGADQRLAVQAGPVGQLRVQGQRHGRPGHDLAAHREHAVRLAHPFLEVALDVAEGGDEEVAEGVAGDPLRARRRAREAVLEEPRHDRLGVGEGRDAVADVAHRRDAQLVAQAARRSAVIGHATTAVMLLV